ncbi:restriction endonuclease [Thauera sp. 28]|nr:hypothetical protein [Thauera sp. 28]ENO91114.1 restriction endonuclease [Thauera sp. 28]
MTVPKYHELIRPLIDGEEFARLAVEHKAGVSVKRRIELKRLDSDFFDEL